MTTGRHAALDMGTNSFHLVVAELTDTGSLRTVTREKEMLRLGDAVATTGMIGPELRERALHAVVHLAGVAAAQGVDRVVACATSAIREATDGAEFVDDVRERTGVDVEVISGEREARLVFRAVQASVDLGDERFLGVDIGGGSVEFAVGTQQDLDWVASHRLGVGRLTAEWVDADPLGGKARRAMAAAVREALEPVAAEARFHRYHTAVGTSGTWLALARLVAAEAGEEVANFDGWRVDLDALRALCDRLARSTAAQRRALPGVEARRADLLPAAGVLVRVILDVFEPESLVTSTWGLREGILLEEYAHPVFAFGDPSKVRTRSIHALGRRHRIDEVHGRQTQRLVSALFDALAAELGLDERYREPLEHAAYVHDIGNVIARSSHHKHGAYLVHHAELAGFEPDDRALVEALVRWHRSGTPRAGRPEFDALGAADADALFPLLALLRVADGLDSSRHANVLGVDVRPEPERIVIRLVSTAGDPGLDLWGGRRKAELLAEVSGRDVTLVGPGERLASH